MALAYGRTSRIRGGQIVTAPTDGSGGSVGEKDGKIPVVKDKGCKHSHSCLHCTAADLCKDCSEPSVSCLTCKVMLQCQMFNLKAKAHSKTQ